MADERKFISASDSKKTSTGAPKKTSASTSKSTSKAPASKAPASKAPASKKAQNVKPANPNPTSKTNKQRATGLRIGAVVLWLAAIACEVLTILLINGTFYIPASDKLNTNTTTYIIIGIILDLILVIIGSQLWKKSNDLDPASKKNKVKFFLWNQMGVIAAVIAFFPLLILLLKDKDLDEKTKKILSIIAAAAMLISVGTSIDYNPTSAEDLAAAESEAVVLGDGTVYWTQFGKSYHLNPDCRALKNSKNIYYGDMDEAFGANRNDPCDFCAIEGAADLLQKSLVSGSDLTDIFPSGTDIAQ